MIWHGIPTIPMQVTKTMSTVQRTEANRGRKGIYELSSDTLLAINGHVNYLREIKYFLYPFCINLI